MGKPVVWKSVEGYIGKAYDVKQIKHIYIHADGGRWTGNGLEAFPNVVPVMDGYHFYKQVKAIARRHPARNVRVVILNALAKDDRRKADQFIQEIAEDDTEILKLGGNILS